MTNFSGVVVFSISSALHQFYNRVGLKGIEMNGNHSVIPNWKNAESRAVIFSLFHYIVCNFLDINHPVAMLFLDGFKFLQVFFFFFF